MAMGKEMTNDSVLEFEQRRNVPTRYNRDLMVKTLQAMMKVDEIKKRRQERFFKKRMDAAKGQKRSSTENELMTHVDLISDPKVKAYIQKKKAAKLEAKRATGIWRKKDVLMADSEESDEEMDMEGNEEEER